MKNDLAAHIKFLRDEGQSRPDACVQERDYCSRLTAIADSLEAISAAGRAFLQRMDEVDAAWPEPEGGDLARASGYEYTEKPNAT